MQAACSHHFNKNTRQWRKNYAAEKLHCTNGAIFSWAESSHGEPKTPIRHGHLESEAKTSKFQVSLQLLRNLISQLN